MATNTGTAVGYSKVNISTQTTTTPKTTGGILGKVILNTPVATSVITLYDAITATGTPIATITVPANPVPTTLHYDIELTTGLTIVTGTASSNITVTFI